MKQVNHLLPEAVKAILIAVHLPELPVDLSFLAGDDIEALERPYLRVACDGGTAMHPRLWAGDLVVSLHTRVDETTDEEAALWHAAAADFLTAHSASVAATLEPYDLDVKKMNPSGSTEAVASARGREYSQTWKLVIEDVSG